jgi:predicted transcriptional regulator
MKQPPKERTPETRGSEIIKQQRRRIRRKYKSTAHKGSKPRFPGEVQFKQDMSIILSLAGYTQKEIGLSLGEAQQTISDWLNNDPEVRLKYEKVSAALPESAKILLETYTIEAVHTLVDVMRTEMDNKIVLDAAKEILDRGGLPKLSRQEKESTERQEWVVTDDNLTDRLREASPEIQEEAAQIIESLEMLLSKHAEEKAKRETEDEPME